MTHPSPLDESPLMIEAQNTIGQLIMFMQVSNAIIDTRMQYGEPMNGFEYELISHLDPDAIFSNAPCLASGFATATASYAFVIISPVCFMACLGLAFLVGKFCFRGFFMFDGLFNVIGEVLIEFYISITLAIFAPFNCYNHPNGATSVQKYPEVLCGNSEHTTMVALAVFGILAYPLFAMVVALFMTWQYPRSMLKSDISLLVRGRFLFDRWTPHCYWFCNVSLIRNFMVAVWPCVMAEDDLDITILLMTLSLLVALVLLVWFQPRRTRRQNRLDVCISFVQIVIICFGVTSVHGQPLRRSLSTACVTLVCIVVFSVVSLTAYRFIQFALKLVTYSIYLSHHSGAGGTSCRTLHGVILNHVKGTIMYDIDNLGTDGRLGTLIDAVRVAMNCVVVFGSETLCRPWCIASIVCATERGFHCTP